MRNSIKTTSLLVAAFCLTTHLALAFDMSSQIEVLDHRVTDAEYSSTLDRLITVSATPSSRLNVHDPVLGTTQSLNLSIAPTSVGLSPDGLLAAVGHNGWVTYVDLVTLTTIEVFPCSCDVLDIVLRGNGWIYAFPRFGQWERIRCIEIATGAETDHSGLSIRAGTLVQPHPDGVSIYGANNGLSPSDIEKYSTAGGTAQFLYDSPYHGTYPMCGNLWISDEGLRIFTRCGYVFRSSPNQSEDMTYNGSLSNTSYIGGLHHSSNSGKIVAIPSTSYGTPEDTRIDIYDYDFLDFEAEFDLPMHEVSGTDYSTHGRFVFHSSSGDRAFIIVQVNDSAGMLLDYGIATYEYPGACQGEATNTCMSLPNSSGQAASIGVTGSFSVTDNDLVLNVDGSPLNTPGQFMFGAAPGSLPFGDGYLCIDMFGSGIHRPWSVVYTDSLGTSEQRIQFPDLPGGVQISGGSTHYFQFWFRDPQGPGGTGFNLSDAVQISFCN